MDLQFGVSEKKKIFVKRNNRSLRRRIQHLDLGRNRYRMDELREKVLKRQTPEANSSGNSLQLPHPLDLLIKTEVHDPPLEPPVWTNDGIKTEPQPISTGEEELAGKLEIFRERLLLRNGGMNSTPLESIDADNALDNSYIVKKEAVEMDGDVLLAHYNKHLSSTCSNCHEGAFSSVKGRQLWPRASCSKVVGTQPVSGESESQAVTVDQYYKGEIPDDEYQCNKYQPVVRLERLSDSVVVALGLGAPLVPTGGKHREEGNTEKEKPVKQTVRTHKGNQQPSQTQIHRGDKTLVGRSDDPETRRLPGTRKTELSKGESGIYGRPLQTTSKHLDTHRTCEDVSATNNLPQSNPHKSSVGVQGQSPSLKSEKQAKCICRICGKRFISRYRLTLHRRTHTGKKAFHSHKHKAQTTCKICGKTFTSSQYLKIHILVHTGEKPHTCDICQKEFRQLPHLKQHMLTHTGEKPHICDVCHRSFTDKTTLKRHRLIHTGEKPHECDICHKSFADKCNLKQHMFIHRTEKFHICDICNKDFKSRACLKIHTRIHTGERPFSCGICQKGFTKRSELNRHIQIHTGEKKHTCNICQKRFMWRNALNVHMRIHTAEKLYTCAFCQERFTRRSQLDIHMRIHTGERPHACDICHKYFARRNALKNHIRTHTGEKPYNCGICNKRFTERGALNKHMRIHTGEKPHTCDICQKRFRMRGRLNEHRRVHTGEKPYTCNLCQKRFTTQSGLIVHMRVHTGEKPHTCEICHIGFGETGSLRRHMSTHTGERPHICDICNKAYTRRDILRKHMLIHQR